MKEYTIVIATAVRNTLPNLLKAINDSTLHPIEVIISIPKGKSYLPRIKYNFDIQIISEAKGQVAQRIAGFKKVKTPLCIQMDDDFVFNKLFLFSFVKSFQQLPKNSALSPLLISNKQPFSSLISPKPMFSSFIYYILDSKLKPTYGSITKSGIPIGINPLFNRSKESSIVKSEWLPGACLIHETANLLFNWNYPYQGKAYAEDLMHSQLLKKQNINLYVDRNLEIILDYCNHNNVYKSKSYFKDRILSFRALTKVPDIKISLTRYIFYTILYYLSKLISYFIKLIKG